jgi:hypothetical protein
MTPYQNVCIPTHHPCKHDWRLARLTELLLMGHSWKTVQKVLNISKPEFDQLLDDAVEQAKAKQSQVCQDYLQREHSDAA